jgi:hypothetical protein
MPRVRVGITEDRGPRIYLHNDCISTSDIVRFIDALEKRFGFAVVFDLEPITEGGIKMSYYPGMEFGTLKTIRFPRFAGKWPTIEPKATLEQWRAGDEYGELIWHRRYPTPLAPKKRPGPDEGFLFLKALRGAPAWSARDVKFIKAALYEVGLGKKRICR